MSYIKLLTEIQAGTINVDQAYVLQLKMLDAKLDPRLIASRSQGGADLSYLETQDAIQILNHIFGQANWDIVTSELKEVQREEREKNGKQQFLVGYTAQSSLTVKFINGVTVVKNDVGAGNGTDYQGYYSTSESSVKEACSDSLKRCARHLGNSLGLALYDKQKRRVGYDEHTVLLYPVTSAELRSEATKSTVAKELTKAYLESTGKKLLSELSDVEISEVFKQLVAV